MVRYTTFIDILISKVLTPLDVQWGYLVGTVVKFLVSIIPKLINSYNKSLNWYIMAHIYVYSAHV